MRYLWRGNESDRETCVSASNNDVDIITEKLLCCTTPCFEALTERNDKNGHTVRNLKCPKIQ